MTIDEYKNKWHEIELAEANIFPKLDELEKTADYSKLENIEMS